MKNTLLCLVLCFGMSAYAQSGKVYVTGSVTDSETMQPVSYATIRLLSLPDSTLLTGVASDNNGRFKLSATHGKEQAVLLNITYVGYSPYYKKIPLLNKRSFDIGTVLLAPEGLLLDEAVVIGKAPMAVTEQDTTIFNASAYRTPEGSMLEDLAKQLPGGEINEEGKLMIHGKEVKKILVDGKEFFSDDPKVALKNLPVEIVEKLKAYERKSDLARLTGIDDGDEEMILDLSVKKGMKTGWMENFMAGIGTKDRYEVANTLNRLRDNSQFTLIGNLNNTNNQGFSELQQESASASGNVREQAGLTNSRSLGMNISHEWNRVKLRSNVQYSDKDHSEDSRIHTDNIMKQNNSVTQSIGNNNTTNRNLVANTFIEWKIDSLTTLIFRPQYRYTSSDRRGNGQQQGLENEELLNERKSSNENTNTRHNLTLMWQISRKLSKRGRNIALRVDYGLNLSDVKRQSFSTTHYFKNDLDKTVNQKINTGEDGHDYRLQFIYSEPLPWMHFLQFRYSFQYKVTNADRYVYNWDADSDDFETDYDGLSSNCFENQYSTHLFNIGIRTNRKKYNYTIGLDFAPQKSDSYSFLNKEARGNIEKNVFNFSPTVNFRYKHSKRTQLQIIYRGKGKQPRVNDLQPVADVSNPLNIRVGNPDLKPSYTHTFTLNFRTYNAKHQRNMVVLLQAENIMNNVTNRVTYDDETGGRTTIPVNQNGNWNASGSFSMSTPVLGKKLLLRNYSYIRYRNQNGFTNLSKEEPIKSTVRHLTLRERLQLTYRHSLYEIGAHGEVLYNNSNNTIRNNRAETCDYRIGGDLQFYLPWGFEFYSEATYFIRSGYGYEGNSHENVIWSGQLSKSLLKHKQLLLRLKVYDILHQENSLVRTVTATAIRDADYNSLGSYFMFHLIWRFMK